MSTYTNSLNETMIVTGESYVILDADGNTLMEDTLFADDVETFLAS